MTVFDASVKVYEWFSKNDSFCESDFLKILTISETPEADRASVLASLETFEKAEMIKKINYKDNNYWILSKAFSSMNQDLSITSNTAIIIAQLINQYCDMIESDSDRCDPSRITEKDIKNILYILTEMTLDKLKKNK